ncbi:MAG: sigma-70 family RNA polymerase sigma factor [Actinomycetota bacterium]
MILTTDQVRLGFEQALEPVLDPLFGAALRYTRNRADAEDLVQTTVIKAWRAYDKFEPRSENAFKAWMFTILQNAWISEYRRRSRRVQEVSAETDEGFSLFDALVETNGSAEAAVLSAIPDSEVKAALESLNEDFRTAVVLCDVEGFSYGEIAEITGVPVGTVMSRIHRGRKALQRALWDFAKERGLVNEEVSG